MKADGDGGQKRLPRGVFFTERRGHLECRATRTVDGKRFVALADRGLKSEAAMIADAVRKLELLIEEAAPNSERISVLQYLERYVIEKERSGDIRFKSRETYESYVRLHVAPYAIAKVQLAKVKEKDLRDYLHALEIARVPSSTRRETYKLLKAALARAVRNRMLAATPCVYVDVPKHRKKHRRPLSYAIVENILGAIEGHPLEAFFWLACTRAYRMSEIIGLRVESFDFLDGTLTVADQLLYPKGKGIGGVIEPLKGGEASVRVHAQHPKVVALLRASKLGKRPSDFLFQNRIGGPLRPANFRNRVWYPLLASLGLPKTPFHRFRNTAIELIRETSGNDLGAIRNLAGHATRAQAVDYLDETHRLPEALTNAADDHFDRNIARARAAKIDA